MRLSVGAADPALDALLTEKLTAFNASVTVGVTAPEDLTAQIRCGDELVAGISGWSWAEAAGIGLLWVSEQQRGCGIGRQLLDAFEDEARRRDCQRVFVTSFTFQAPAFYEKAGFREIFRWHGFPTTGRDDVHLVKDL